MGGRKSGGGSEEGKGEGKMRDHKKVACCFMSR